jgi:hypothetical protein
VQNALKTHELNLVRRFFFGGMNISNLSKCFRGEIERSFSLEIFHFATEICRKLSYALFAWDKSKEPLLSLLADFSASQSIPALPSCYSRQQKRKKPLE